MPPEPVKKPKGKGWGGIEKKIFDILKKIE